MAREVEMWHMIHEWPKAGESFTNQISVPFSHSLPHIRTWCCLSRTCLAGSEKTGKPLESLARGRHCSDSCFCHQTLPFCWWGWPMDPSETPNPSCIFPWAPSLCSKTHVPGSTLENLIHQNHFMVTGRPLCLGHMWVDRVSGSCWHWQDWHRNMWWLKVSGRNQDLHFTWHSG